MSEQDDPELTAFLAKHGRSPVTVLILHEAINVLQEGLKAAFQKHRDARLALEQRVAALEATPSLKFTGTYMDTNTYVPGDCTTRQGGLWVCMSATTGPFDHAAWVLAVKKGDAR